MSVFASRDFTRLWVAGAASTLGSQLAFVALPLFAFALTGSATFAGLVGFANALTRTLAGIPAGLVVDRCNRKSVMVWCDALRAVAISALVVLALAGRLEAWSLVLLIAVEGALSVLFPPAETAALRHVVPSAELPVAFARSESRSWAAALVGPPLGGLLFSLAPVLPFAGNSVAYVLSLLAIAGLRTDLSAPPRPVGRQPLADRPSAEQRPAAPRLLTELGRGFRRLAADVFLRLTTVQVALHNVALGALSLIVVLRAEQQGLPGVLIGVLVAAQATGALLGSLAAPRLLDRLAAGRIVLLTGWSWCALVPVIAFTGRPAVVLPCLVALWFLVPVQRSVIGLYQVRGNAGRAGGAGVQRLRGRHHVAVRAGTAAGWLPAGVRGSDGNRGGARRHHPRAGADQQRQPGHAARTRPAPASKPMSGQRCADGPTRRRPQAGQWHALRVSGGAQRMPVDSAASPQMRLGHRPGSIAGTRAAPARTARGGIPPARARTGSPRASRRASVDPPPSRTT